MGESELSYYQRNSISTEHGVDDDREKHLARRRKLYRQLGIPVLAFRGSDILEIGPGAGHNSLPLIKEWGAEHIDLVEPNETARKELYEKFKKNEIPENKYSVYAETMEGFCSQKKYDLIIAEGAIHGSENWEQWMESISGYAHKDSIVIVTCTDEIAFYIEKVKRALLRYATRKLTSHAEKMRVLKGLLEPQLRSLNGMSRLVEDWIEDQILAPYTLQCDWMTMGMAMDFYRYDFDVLGSSQDIFVDHSWYKDIDHDHISSCIEQYEEKKHMFMLAGNHCETRRTAEENRRLEDAVLNAGRVMRRIEEMGSGIADMIPAIKKVSEHVDDIDVLQFNVEAIKIAEALQADEEIVWEHYKYYMRCFGKTLQYVSFVKK